MKLSYLNKIEGFTCPAHVHVSHLQNSIDGSLHAFYKTYLSLVNVIFLRTAARQCGRIPAVDLSITNFCGIFGFTVLYWGTDTLHENKSVC